MFLSDKMGTITVEWKRANVRVGTVILTSVDIFAFKEKRVVFGICIGELLLTQTIFIYLFGLPYNVTLFLRFLFSRLFLQVAAA